MRHFSSLAAPAEPFTLDPLPYPKNGLSPHISEETLDYHYGKHHAAYVTNLNKCVENMSSTGLECCVIATY